MSPKIHILKSEFQSLWKWPVLIDKDFTEVIKQTESTDEALTPDDWCLFLKKEKPHTEEISKSDFQKLDFKMPSTVARDEADAGRSLGLTGQLA